MNLTSLPLVSVIAVCHDHKDYVIQALEGIRNQTYPCIELIIINNCKDECEELIRNWIFQNNISCSFIQNEIPQSFPSNLNMALSQISGVFFQAISCDDIMLKDKISLQVGVFSNSDNRLACVYGDALLIDADNKVDFSMTLQERKAKKWNLNLFSEGGLRKELTTLSYVPAPTVLLRTEIIRSLGLYDERMVLEDWPMWLKISEAGYVFACVPEVLIYYRVLNGSLGSNLLNSAYNSSLMLFYEENIHKLNFSNIQTFKNFYSVVRYSSKTKKNILLLIRAIVKSFRIFNLKYLIRFLILD